MRLVIEGIGDKDEAVSHRSIGIIGERHREIEPLLAKAEPAIGARIVAAIEKAVPLDKVDRGVADALAEMGTDAAADLLVQYSRVEDRSACPHALDSFQHGIRWNRRHG